MGLHCSKTPPACPAMTAPQHPSQYDNGRVTYSSRISLRYLRALPRPAHGVHLRAVRLLHVVPGTKEEGLHLGPAAGGLVQRAAGHICVCTEFSEASVQQSAMAGAWGADATGRICDRRVQTRQCSPAYGARGVGCRWGQGTLQKCGSAALLYSAALLHAGCPPSKPAGTIKPSSPLGSRGAETRANKCLLITPPQNTEG